MKLFNWRKGRGSQEIIIEFLSCLIKLSENDHMLYVINDAIEDDAQKFNDY